MRSFVAAALAAILAYNTQAIRITEDEDSSALVDAAVDLVECVLEDCEDDQVLEIVSDVLDSAADADDDDDQDDDDTDSDTDSDDDDE